MPTNASTRRLYALFLAVLFMLIATSRSVVLAERANQVEPQDAPFWIDVGLRPQHVEWFNATANPHDIARADHVRLAGVLDEVSVGRKLIVFKSIEDAERILPFLGNNIDIIGYNLEHGPNNPPSEQSSPVDSVRRMSELADQYGLKLAMGPDRTFAVDLGVEMAPYVDIFIIQVQRAQTQPETVRSFVVPLIRQLRAANPEMEVSIQIRTEGDVSALADLIVTLRDDLDGVSVLTNPDPEMVAITYDLVDELRLQLDLYDPGGESGGPGLLPSPTPEPDAPLATSAVEEMLTPRPLNPAVDPTATAIAATPSAAAPLTPVPAPGSPSTQSWPFTLLALGVAGGGLLIVTLMFILQQRGPR